MSGAVDDSVRKAAEADYQRARVAADPLVQLLEETLGGIEAAAGLVGAFYDDGQGGAQRELFEELHALERRLGELDKARDALAPLGDAAMVPLDLLDHLDRVDKCNPDVYSRHKLDFLLEEKLRLKRVKADFDAVCDVLSEEAAKP
jgi:hypothetical protein